MLSMPEITRLLGVPMHALVAVVGALERRNIIVQSQDVPPIYLPARDLSTITVVEVLEAVRAAGEEHFFLPNGLPAPDGVDGLIDRLHEAARSALGTMTLRDLAAESGEVRSVPTAPREGSLGSPE